MKEKSGFTRCLDWRVNDHNRYAHFETIPSGINLQLIQTGWHVTDANYSYGPMVRDHFLIHFIRKGRGVMSDMRHEYSIHKNQCFLICPGRMSLYEADADTPWEYYWLGFSGPWGEELLAEMQLDADHPVADLTDPERLFGLLQRMSEAIGPRSNYLLLTGLMYEVLDALRSARGSDESASPTTRFSVQDRGRRLAESIITMVETSYSQKMNISDIARNLGFSRSYMTEIFHQETGMSISEFITEYRMQRAGLLLKDPTDSIQQVAYRCGYSDPLFFSRMFKKHYGISPSRYREKFESEAPEK